MPIKLISGAGGSLTVTPASTASNYTLTVPAVTANVVTTGDSNTITQTMMNTGFYGGYGPAFSAYPSVNQTFSAGATTKVVLDQKLYDTANAFDSSTNYRFQPLVAGYYNLSIFMEVSSGAVTRLISKFYKNGSLFAVGLDVQVSGSPYINSVNGTTLMYLNGSTDYAEFYTTNSGGFVGASAAIYQCNFAGFLARAG